MTRRGGSAVSGLEPGPSLSALGGAIGMSGGWSGGTAPPGDPSGGGWSQPGAPSGGWPGGAPQSGGWPGGGWPEGGGQGGWPGGGPTDGGGQGGWPGGGQGGWPGRGWPGGATSPPRNGAGVAALVCGIVSIPAILTVIGGLVFGVVAVVAGFVGRSRAKHASATNGGVALAGIILGALGLAGSILVLVLVIVLVVGHVADFRAYSTCVQHATTLSAREACATNFTHELLG